MIRAQFSRRKPRRLAIVAALLPALLAASPAVSDTVPLASRLDRSVKEAQALVESVRGVPFGGTVPSAILPEKDLPKLLEKKLVEDLPASFDRYAATLVAVGLLDPTPDLLKRLVRLYSRQVAGFYDPEERKFYVVPERSSEESKELSELGVTTSSVGGFMESALLAHELTHALQDRRLDLDKRLKSLKGSTDSLLAMEAFLEGEATVVMIEALLKTLPEEARSLLSTNMLTEMMSSLASGSNVEGAEGVPEFFVKELLFPYAAGTDWVQKKRAQGGGWTLVEEAYRHPPSSTSDILHPDGVRDRAPLPEAEVPRAKDVPKGSRPLYSDTLGEWVLKTLLERAGAGEGAGRLAASRTDDRILFFEQGEQSHVGFVWRLRCASPEAARSLADALGPAYTGRPAPARPAIRVRGSIVDVSRGLD
jgi:hypothetical protein